jgi:hypothetical protein
MTASSFFSTHSLAFVAVMVLVFPLMVRLFLIIGIRLPVISLSILVFLLARIYHSFVLSMGFLITKLPTLARAFPLF